LVWRAERQAEKPDLRKKPTAPYGAVGFDFFRHQAADQYYMVGLLVAGFVVFGLAAGAAFLAAARFFGLFFGAAFLAAFFLGLFAPFLADAALGAFFAAFLAAFFLAMVVAPS
jgi:hypothetical protein